MRKLKKFSVEEHSLETDTKKPRRAVFVRPPDQDTLWVNSQEEGLEMYRELLLAAAEVFRKSQKLRKRFKND